jgi:hypothetical protein
MGLITVFQGACVLAGYLKLLPLFIMVFPGMAARILFPDEVSHNTPFFTDRFVTHLS